MKWFTKSLIILLLASLISIPPLLAGYINLKLAETNQNNADASRYYESAAKFLFWQPELYEEAGLLAHDEPKRAIYLLTLAGEKGSLTPGGQVSLGDAYLSNGQTDQAISTWENLIDLKKEILSVGPRLAQVYHTKNQFANETRILNLWLETDKKNQDASKRLGLLLAASGSIEALPLLNTAVNGSQKTSTQLGGLISALNTPDDNSAYRLTRCGQALAGLNEWPLAEQAFALAVNTNNKYAEAWAWLGLARQHNNSPGAKQALENALSLDQKSAAIRAMLGAYLQQNGDPGQAFLQFQAATQLEPNNPAWWSALGGAAAQSDLSVALNAYARAVDLAPQEAAYWYALATFCVEKNVYMEDYGLRAALRAYALDPNNLAYMDMLGRAQMALGQSDAAEIMFNKALQEGGSSNPVYMVHFHLGLLYMQTNRPTLAKFEFEKTLESDPQGPFGAQAKKLIDRYFP